MIDADVRQSRLYSEDLAPVPSSGRKWGWRASPRCGNGVSGVAIVALIAGVLPSLPGFLEEVKLLPPGAVPRPLAELYHYAWFVGFAVAFVTYLSGRRLVRAAQEYPPGLLC